MVRGNAALSLVRCGGCLRPRAKSSPCCNPRLSPRHLSGTVTDTNKIGYRDPTRAAWWRAARGQANQGNFAPHRRGSHRLRPSGTRVAAGKESATVDPATTKQVWEAIARPYWIGQADDLLPSAPKPGTPEISDRAASKRHSPRKAIIRQRTAAQFPRAGL